MTGDIAEHADIAAQAEAIRFRSAEPKRTVPKADERIADLERRLLAVRAAQEGAVRDLADVIATHGTEYRGDTAARVAAKRRRLAELVEAYAETRLEVASLDALDAWLDSSASRPRSFRLPETRSIRLGYRRSGGPVLASIVTELEADANRPRSEPSTAQILINGKPEAAEAADIGDGGGASFGAAPRPYSLRTNPMSHQPSAHKAWKLRPPWRLPRRQGPREAGSERAPR